MVRWAPVSPLDRFNRFCSAGVLEVDEAARDVAHARRLEVVDVAGHVRVDALVVDLTDVDRLRTAVA